MENSRIREVSNDLIIGYPIEIVDESSMLTMVFVKTEAAKYIEF